MPAQRRGVALLTDSLFWDPEGLPASSWTARIPFLGWLVSAIRPQNAVELGVGTGVSFRPLCIAMSRFSAGGRCVGIDTWKDTAPSPARPPSDLARLREFCDARFPQSVTLLDADWDRALGSFDDESIDLLHATAKVFDESISQLDLTHWVPKMRPGGVIVLSGSGQEFGDVTLKAWRRVSEGLPSATFVVAGPIGVVQLPCEERSPIVDALRSDRELITSVFRTLGERLEFRYLFGSEPITANGIRKHVERLLDDHLQEVQRSQAVHKLELERYEALLGSSMTRLSEQGSKIASLEREENLLLAKLAHFSTVNERKLADARREIEQLTREYQHTVVSLHAHLEDRRAEVEAMLATRSWKITKPLRVAVRVWSRVRALGRRL